MEKRKKHLQSLRDLRAPLDHEEILEHSKKVELILKDSLEEKKRDREERM
jgi:hypothetical protein